MNAGRTKEETKKRKVLLKEWGSFLDFGKLEREFLLSRKIFGN
jgi:hypothetical protein